MPLAPKSRNGHPTFCRRISLLFVTLQIAIQTGASDPQNMRGAQAVALTHVQHPLDVHFPDFVERQWPPLVSLQRALPAVLQVLGQVR